MKIVFVENVPRPLLLALKIEITKAVNDMKPDAYAIVANSQSEG